MRTPESEYDPATFHYHRPFVKRYQRYRSLENNATDALERPLVRSLLPEVEGKSVLDLGCGDGEFCEFLINSGAKEVCGIDSSESMLAKAYERMRSGMTFIQSPLEEYVSEQNRWDLITSQLTLHYLSHLDSTFDNIGRWLKPGGHFLFSVNHPLHTSSLGRSVANLERDMNDEGPRPHSWLGSEVLKYHRKEETYRALIDQAGLKVTAAKSSTYPVTVAIDDKRITQVQHPIFIAFLCNKPYL